MRFRRSVSFGALALGLASMPAHADDGTRWFLGTTTGSSLDSSRLVAAGRSQREGGRIFLGLEAGHSVGLHPHVAVLVLARLASWTTERSRARGESRSALDLMGSPEFRLRLAGTRNPTGTVTVRLAAPFGYSQAWIDEAPHADVREIYAGGYGHTYGVTASIDWLRHVPDSSHAVAGVYFGCSTFRRVNSFYYDALSLHEPGVITSERHRFVTNALLVTLGAAIQR